MVKAKLISDSTAYKKAKMILAWASISLLILYLFYNHIISGFWGLTPLPGLQYMIINVGLLIIVSAFMLFLNKKIKNSSGKSQIEIDVKQVCIWEGDRIIQRIDLMPNDNIILNIINPYDSVNSLKEYKGNSPVSSIEIRKGGGDEIKRFEFLVESFYMMNQLEKLKSYWASKKEMSVA